MKTYKRKVFLIPSKIFSVPMARRSIVTQVLYPPSRAINYHWPGPSALERKFVSLIEEQNDDEVGTIRHSRRQSCLSVDKDVQVSPLRVRSHPRAAHSRPSGCQDKLNRFLMSAMIRRTGPRPAQIHRHNVARDAARRCGINPARRVSVIYAVYVKFKGSVNTRRQ